MTILTLQKPVLNGERSISVIDLLSSKGKVKILYLLSKNEELNITQIVRASRMNSSQINQHLNFFVKNEIIEEKKFGRVKIYRLMTEFHRIKLLKSFFSRWNEYL